jgi:hypothetical protein
MSRADVVDATYAVAAGLNDLKDSYGAIAHREAELVRARMRRERDLLDAFDAEEDQEEAAPTAMHGESHGASGGLDLVGGSLSPPSEITWKRRRAPVRPS